ncbi:MAG TPA: hypothetical protein VMU42_12540 [Candidatus Sulfotelmatobacter sp.]|nr:hypothetical protein [Candidatus Sulfotelmatobacter sp.]
MLDHIGRKAVRRDRFLRSSFLRSIDTLRRTAQRRAVRISYAALIGRKNPLSSTTWRG